MNNAQKQEVLTDIQVSLESFLYNAFIDLPQMMGCPINELHDDILSCLLTRIAQTHHEFYVESEEEEE
jgi:hypothetical protein